MPHFMLLFQTGFNEERDLHNEFVFAIPYLFERHQPHVMISTSSQQPVDISITIPGISFQQNYTINKTNGADISLPTSSHILMHVGKQNRTVIVRASDTVSVYAIDNDYEDGDAFQALPSSQLGTEYYIASFRPWHIYPSFLCVSAIHANTSVSISNQSGLVNHVVLEQYESFRYDGDADADEDLSGFFVQSDKTVAVVSGSSSIIPGPDGTADGLLDAMIPVQNFARNFVLFPFLSLSSEFLYRVFASHASTTLSLSNGNVTLDEPGDYYEGSTSEDTVISMEADKPVMTVLYMKGSDSGTRNMGDPSMLVVPPVSAYTNNVTFPVFNYTHQEPHVNFINVVISCDNIDGLLFDGTNMTSWNKLTTDDYSMCCLRGNVPVGFHSVTHGNLSATFFVYVYAVNWRSSYTYSASGIEPVLNSGKFS